MIVTHHKDGNPYNNSPDNLVRMSAASNVLAKIEGTIHMYEYIIVLNGSVIETLYGVDAQAAAIRLKHVRENEDGNKDAQLYVKVGKVEN